MNEQSNIPDILSEVSISYANRLIELKSRIHTTQQRKPMTRFPACSMTIV